MKEVIGLKSESDWLEAFIYQWAMAGDLISRQYSGTPSCLTKYTLKGYQNLYDKIEQKMIGYKRWKKQTFTDDFKEECILILQGVHKDESDDFVRQAIQQKELNKEEISPVKTRSFVDPHSITV